MEFATVATAAGVQVTVLQRGERVMDRFDPDLVDALQESCTVRMIDIRTNVETHSIERSDDGFTVHITEGNGTATTIETGLVIAALGRIPNIEALNLDVTKVTADRRGIPYVSYL